MASRLQRLWLLAAAACLALSAQAREWTSEADRSRLDFTFRFDGEDLRGEFRRFDVTWSESADAGHRLEVRVDVTSADLFSRELNEGVGDSEWFDHSRFPLARYLSESISETAEGQFEVSGELELKGLTHPLRLKLAWEALEPGARISGSVEIDRSEYGIGSGEWAEDDVVGRTVQVEFDVRLVRRD